MSNSIIPIDIDKDIDTNIFETKTGALNLAPLKISGQYKIVVTENNDLFFDDYNNKRVLINKGQKFLPQLSNFLKTPSTISDFSKLRYGGFSKISILSYHAPLYIGKNNLIPDYFLINNIGYGNSENDINNITDSVKLGNISSLKRIIDIKKTGLQNIFKEIIDSNNYLYPFYSDFENHKIIIYGFDYEKSSKVRKEISLLNNASNQTYFGSVNNNILNHFQNNNIIFPKFINIEFEFSDNQNPNNLFGNYYGFYSYEKNIMPEYYDYYKNNNKYGIFTVEDLDNNNIIYQKQTWINKTKKYKNLLFNTNSIDTQNKIPFARLKFNFLFDNDFIKIYDAYDNIFFEYRINQNQLKSTFRETLIELAKNITKESENQIICKLDSKLINTLNFEISSNVTDLYFKTPEQINQYEFIDLFNTDLNPKYNNSKATKLFFKEIGDNDLIINNIFDTQDINTINGSYLKFSNNQIYYKISEYFIYNGVLCCRLISDNSFVSTLRNENLLIQIFEEIDTKLFYHKPLPFLNYIKNDIIIESNEQFDKNKYITELKNKFDSDEFKLALESFQKFKINDEKQFISNYVASNFLYNTYPNVNNKQVLNMKFGSYGFTSFITPNLFNFDLSFYDTNGNVIFEQEDLDKIKFHWFLIKSKTPEYLNDKYFHLSKLRYFTDKPQITSKLIDTGTHCETIFMGVKYTLPRKYNNYLFAVYLEYDKVPESDVINDDDSYEMNSYSFEVNNSEKTIYLKINKYLDFIDLLRGGKIKNEPFIDLSFLYSVRQSYNTKSDLVMTFKSGGLLICDDTVPTLLNGEVTKDWKKKISTPEGDKWLICLKRSTLVNTSPLSDLIPQDGEVIFFVYSRWKNITYQSMSLKLSGIQYVGNDYVWCEDISIKWYDTKKLLINEWKENIDNYELFKFSSDDELISEDSSYTKIDNTNIEDSNLDNTFLTVYIGNDNKRFKILNSKKVFSLRQDYIEKTREVRYLDNGKIETKDNLFYFPEFKGNLNDWNNYNFDLDNTSANQKINIFDRNQLWFIIKTIISTELKFKHNTESQTIKIINELLLANLYEYSNFNSIPIDNSNEFIKLQVVANDFNAVIWNIEDIDGYVKTKLCKLCRYSGPNIPIMEEINDLSEFQIINHNKNQLLNIFDEVYGNLKETNESDSFLNVNNKIGYSTYHINLEKSQSNSNSIVTTEKTYDINAIGLWDELKGNIISSLFIKNDDIITTIKNVNTNTFNAITLFKTNISNENQITVNQNILDQLLFNNLFPDKNKNYISKFNYNLDEYIYNIGIEWLLNNFYYLYEIRDNDNINIKFTYDNLSKNIEIDINNYQPNGNYELIWKRK